MYILANTQKYVSIPFRYAAARDSIPLRYRSRFHSATLPLAIPFATLPLAIPFATLPLAIPFATLPLAIPFATLPLAIPFHFISFHFISFHFISFHFIPFHSISFHFISLQYINKSLGVLLLLLQPSNGKGTYTNHQ
jgi:hypothetical protein